MKQIQWYPGHMAKGLEEIKRNLKLANFYIFVLDARIPKTSFNSELLDLVDKRNKKILIILNKADLANKIETKKWITHFSKEYDFCVSTNLKKNNEIQNIRKKINDYTKNMTQVKLMILGIPNVGKSTLINSLINKKSAMEQNKPGITKAINWYRVNKNTLIMDSPGILMPKYENEDSLNLAYTNNIKLDIMPIEEIAYNLIEKLRDENIEMINRYYREDFKPSDATNEIIERIAIKQGILSGGKPNLLTLSNKIIWDFSIGKMGNYTLERFEI